MSLDLVEKLCRSIDSRQPAIWVAEQYYAGTQPLSFLSPESKRILGDRITMLSANYVKLATDSVAERLQVQGFTRAGQSLSNVWGAWVAAGMVERSSDAILEALSTGCAYLTVWADAQGRPVGTVESARDMAVTRDPVSHEITAAVKRWRGDDGKAHAVLYGSGAIYLFNGPDVPEGGVVPNAGWIFSNLVPNPLGVVPVVDFVNQEGFRDFDGTPEAKQIYTLVDALNKILADSMVASESAALPRRWATGLQLRTDDNGQIIPISNRAGSMLATEDAETKFGQFQEPKLEAYRSQVELLIRQIGAISGLPDHLIGIQGVDPSSAEQVRAAGESLVNRVYKRQGRFTRSMRRAAGLFEAILTGGRVSDDIDPQWTSPESRSEAQTADAVLKLVQGGILPWEKALERLGYNPTEIQEMRQMRLREQVDKSPLQLPRREVA